MADSSPSSFNPDGSYGREAGYWFVLCDDSKRTKRSYKFGSHLARIGTYLPLLWIRSIVKSGTFLPLLYKSILENMKRANCNISQYSCG